MFWLAESAVYKTNRNSKSRPVPARFLTSPVIFSLPFSITQARSDDRALAVEEKADRNSQPSTLRVAREGAFVASHCTSQVTLSSSLH